ncbi:MAG: sigma 54-interacting transcriptional regulator [Mangrovicoccus sp.]|nr:sigma 54-interacting transcriptional regulator [Mangrovicoccus sp.]
MAVDCDAGLDPADLFGSWQAGARQEGLLAAADRGTIYLSGIARLAPEIPMRLLRAIETRAYRPAGSPAAVKTKARFILSAGVDPDRAARRSRNQRAAPVPLRLRDRDPAPARAARRTSSGWRNGPCSGATSSAPSRSPSRTPYRGRRPPMAGPAPRASCATRSSCRSSCPGAGK